MTLSRTKNLEKIREKRLLNRFALGIVICGLTLGLIFFFSGRKFENVIENNKIEYSESIINKLEEDFNEKLIKIEEKELNNAQKMNIEGIKTLIAGFKGAEVEGSLIQELSTKIEKLNTYPQK